MDHIREKRLREDYRRIGELADASRDMLNFQAVEGDPPERYILDLDVITLVKPPGEEVQKTRGVLLTVYLPGTYPRRDGPVASVMLPHHIWHPNTRGEQPGLGLVCPGEFRIGHFLDDFIYRLFHILIYQNYTMDEATALNPAAAAWARRAHGENWFPTDHRPLVGSN